jgi:hypothetical protein
VVLEVDYTNAIDETNETNNTATQSFTVGPTPVIDLVPGGITVTPTNPTTSQTVTLGGTVSNVGNTVASGVTWRFLVDGQLAGSGTMTSVPAAGSAPVSVGPVGPYAQGPRTVVLEVDYTNAIDETNETNNTGSLGFTVLPPIVIPDPSLVARRLAECLLTSTCNLGAAEREYVDTEGNKNGAIDVGDLLAWLDKHPGITLSRQLMMRLLSLPMPDSTTTRKSSGKVP